MIRAEFFCSGSSLTGFSVSGHAGFADPGEDIVCASVSSAVQMAANGITEILALKAEVTVEENRVSLSLKAPSKMGEAFLQALRLHLKLLSEDYPKTIILVNSEV